MQFQHWSKKMTNELEHDDLGLVAESGKMHNITSKAGRLAMELSAEKKRLAKELEELQGEYDDIKPLTPTGTRDWYVKWGSMILGVLGVFLISAEIYLFGQIAYLISAIGWIYVGMQWGDRAIMIGSAISGTAVAMFLIENPLLFSQFFN
tara:strand:- start:447 stop:896 length:450 start_codon:yes stop_codon:yes gene_type:complete